MSVHKENIPVAIAKLSSNEEEIQNFLKGDFFSGMILKAPATVAIKVTKLENEWHTKWQFSEWKRSDIGVAYMPGRKLNYTQAVELTALDGTTLCYSAKSKWSRGTCTNDASHHWIEASYGEKAEKLFSK